MWRNRTDIDKDMEMRALHLTHQRFTGDSTNSGNFSSLVTKLCHHGIIGAFVLYVFYCPYWSAEEQLESVKKARHRENKHQFDDKVKQFAAMQMQMQPKEFDRTLAGIMLSSGQPCLCPTRTHLIRWTR